MTRPLLQVLRAPQTYPALPVLRTAGQRCCPPSYMISEASHATQIALSSYGPVCCPRRI